MTLADQLTVARAAIGRRRRRALRVETREHTSTGRPPYSSPRWPRIRSTAGLRGARERASALGSVLDPVADKILVHRDADHGRRHGRVPGLDGRADRRARVPRLGPAARSDRARRRDSRREISPSSRPGCRPSRRPIGGLAAAGAWSDDVAWWALLVALVFTWVSGHRLRARGPAAAPKPARRLVARLARPQAPLGHPPPTTRLGRACAAETWSSPSAAAIAARSSADGSGDDLQLRRPS